MDRLYFPSYPGCFVCGRDNPYGIHLPLWVENDEVKGEFTPEEKFCGFKGVIHGGIITAVLDEILWWASARVRNEPVVTKKITVHFLRPVTLGRPFGLLSEIDETQDKETLCSALMKRDGKLFARAEGVYVPAPGGFDEQLEGILEFRFPDGSEIPRENRLTMDIFG